MKILVIGGSGFLGSKIVESLGEDCRSTYYRNQLFPNQIQLDLGDEMNIRRCLKQTKPEVVLHCGGLTDTDFCESNPDFAMRANCLGTEVLLNEFEGKIVYFSTDYVFDGENAPYDERSQPNPINHYGKTKLFAERKVLERNGNLVVRVSGLYGKNKHNNKFLNRLRSKTLIQASTKLISTPTYINDVIEALPDLIKMSGLVHFSGEQQFSRYEFLRKVVEGLGLSLEVQPSEYEIKSAKRPKNSSLISIYNFKKTKIENVLKEINEEI